MEKGSASFSIGSYMQVLFVLGLDEDILKMASDDVPGRKLQDADLKLVLAISSFTSS